MTRARKISLGLLSAFIASSGVLHFVKPENYLRIVPPSLPAPLALVLLSGAAEIVLGVALLFPRRRPLAAWGIVALLVAVFPANVYMYRHSLETGGAAFEVDPSILYWRLWLQPVFILWALSHTRRDGVRAYPL